ncbi:MAG: PAP2 family protein [Marinilabilia sp.]
MKLFSKILTFLFHPMLMPTLGIFFILNAGAQLFSIPLEAKRLVYIIVFVSSCLLPVSLLPLFLQVKLINSFRMETARERVYPVLSAGLFYFLGYLLLARLNVSPLIEVFVLASLVALLLAVAVSYFWKISIHTLAVGGVTGALFGLMLRFGMDLVPVVSVMLIISGLIAMARLYLNAHTPAQVYAGYAVGFLIVMSGVAFI